MNKSYEGIKLGCSLFFVLAYFGYSGCVDAEVLKAIGAQSVAIPGTGYQTDKMLLTGECVTGTVIKAGSSESSFDLSQSLNQTEASDSLGFAMEGRARFGVVEATASARFLRNSVSDKFSLSAVWSSYYRLPAKRLTIPTLTSVGQAVKDNAEAWHRSCGDKYVSEVRTGATLFFSIRIEFSSEEQKQEFASKFNISGPMFGASGSLDEASKKFSGDTKILVSGIQFGGEVSKLTGLFPNSEEGRSGYVNCTLGDIEKCSTVLRSALVYATDSKEGFPSQLQGENSSAADLEYRTLPYAAAGVGPASNPEITLVAKEARKVLHNLFERYFNLQLMANRLLESDISSSRKDAISKQKETLDENVSAIISASRKCYDDYSLCADLVSSLNLKDIKESVFKLPSSARGSYRVMSTEKGVWSRSDSVDAMCNPWPVRPPLVQSYVKGVGSIELQNVCQGKKIIPRVGEDISEVLYVQGAGLKSAALYIEGKQLKKIDLNTAERKLSKKSGDGWEAIVIESDRKLPGWIDIYVWLEQRRLTKTNPVGEGVYYILIEDIFGRKFRFDVDYLQWKRSEALLIDDHLASRIVWIIKNRRWDPGSSGTSMAGKGNWTRMDAWWAETQWDE